VKEVPRPERDLLTLDEEQALSGEDEEALLVPLAVIEAHRLAGQEPVEIDPDLAERPLAFEVAIHAQWAPVTPPAPARVEDEPAFAVGRKPEPRLAQPSLAHGACQGPGSRVTG
jgi:hypothetical protein